MSANASELDIPLDRSLQVWVLLPIWAATLLMGLLRRNVTVLTTRELRMDLFKVRDANRLKRAQRIRAHASALPPEQFLARRTYLAGPTGVLNVPKKQHVGISGMMSPENLANQVTSLLLALVPHLLLGSWAQYAFMGITACRLPFTLTPRFRGMLQSGIETAGQNLDVSYVSALSWYVLNMFGNAGLLSLITSGSAQDVVLMPSIASQLAMNMSPEKVYTQERDALLKISHRCKMADAEDKLLSVQPAEFAAF